MEAVWRTSSAWWVTWWLEASRRIKSSGAAGTGFALDLRPGYVEQWLHMDGETLVDNGKYLRLNEEELLDKVQAKGERVWDSVPKWHWSGKGIDEVVPPSFKIK